MLTARPQLEPNSKPLLRGVSHEVAAGLALGGAIAMVALAPGVRAKVAAAIYGASLCALFTISALYHRPTWPPRARMVWRRIDHSAIFLLIAGTYTPFCLILGGAGRLLLWVAWCGALCGVAQSIAWPHAPKRLTAGIYVALGWVVLPLLPALQFTLGWGPVLLLVVGGALYTAGAIAYARRRPDPFPRVFGYHEVFHALVVAAACCHFAAVCVAIRAL